MPKNSWHLHDLENMLLSAMIESVPNSGTVSPKTHTITMRNT